MKWSLCFWMFLHFISIKQGYAKWPKGRYGIPMSRSGCPSANWEKGSRTQMTEKGSHASDGHHFSGISNSTSNSITQKFCMKTFNESSGKGWGKGSYCLFRADNSNCPAGFNVGKVYWDDAASLLFGPDQIVQGTVPEGKYDSNTEIQFCCRSDGSVSKPISTPNDNPFYLLRKGPHCQKVESMAVTTEWIHWQDEESINLSSYSGSYPSVRRFSQRKRYLRMYYCYYTKEPAGSRGKAILMVLYIVAGILGVVLLFTLLICLTPRIMAACTKKRKRQAPIPEVDSSSTPNSGNSGMEQARVAVDPVLGTITFTPAPSEQQHYRPHPSTSDDFPPSYEESNATDKNKQIYLNKQLFPAEEHQPMLSHQGIRLSSPPSYEDSVRTSPDV